MRRDSAPSREAGEGVAGTLDARTTGGDFPGSDGACSGHVVPAARPGDSGALGLIYPDAAAVAHCLQTTSNDYSRADGFNMLAYGEDRSFHVVHGTQDHCVSDSVAFALGRNNGGENVICFSSEDYGADTQDDLSPTLRAGGHADSHPNAGVPPAVAYSVALRGREGGATAELGDDLAGCLRASSGGGDKPHVLAPVEVLPFDTTQISSPSNYSRPNYGDPCHPLAAGAHPPAVCVTGAITHTLKAEGFDASEDGTGRGQPIVPSFVPEVGGTLKACAGKSGTPNGAEEADRMIVYGEPPTMAVRRLMPVECERLQGFPDNWTLVPTGKNGKPAADGPRYKQCGNSMATKVMRWIGSRVAWHLATLQPGHNGGPPLDFEADEVLHLWLAAA